MVEERLREEKFDEVLENLWTLKEESKEKLQELFQSVDLDDTRVVVGEMVQDGLVKLEAEKIFMTDQGRERAKEVIRRHRLAERLLTDLLEVEEEEAETSACKFEHILSPEVTDSVCTLLGHPPLCPHGKPIPRGTCCEKFRVQIKPVVTQLTELDMGEEGKIVFMHPKYHGRLDRLSSLGIVPGSIIKLHQKLPSYVIEHGETTLAIDSEIASEIYVKKI